MILIVTERGDLTADYLILELESRGANFLRFNTEDYPTGTKLSWRPDGGEIEIAGRRLLLSEIEAVWYRRPVPPRMPGGYTAEQARWAAGEAAEALFGLWRTLEARWVNHPDANRLAESKPEQLRRAAALGFQIPATLVTNDPDALRSFLATHRECVCKPLLDGVVPAGGDEEEQLFFTSRLSSEALRATDLGPEPYLFQALVEKAADIRVTVVGERVFAVEIESQEDAESAIDWRRGADRGLPHGLHELPEEISTLCLELTRGYGLQFGAIDLAHRPDGGYTFFEINPNGQWAWLEEETGLPLRATLADLLTGGAIPDDD